MSEYTRICPECERRIVHSNRDILAKSIRENRLCKSCCQKGKVFSEEHRKKMSERKLGTKQSMSARLKNSTAQRIRYLNPETRRKTSESIKMALRRPEIRKKHIDALRKIHFLRKRFDDGQLELLNKWGRMGFHFEPNYPLHTDEFLCYIDGYDREHNVVLEYDSKYHSKLSQQEKDKKRQQKIIDILKPKRFWRYDAVNKTFVDVVGES